MVHESSTMNDSRLPVGSGFGIKSFERRANEAVRNHLPTDATGVSISSEMRNTEAINMNAGYLLSVLALVEEYRFLKLRGYANSRRNPDYYDNLWNILFTMRDLLDPKMTTEEKLDIDKKLDMTRNYIARMFQQTDKGIYCDQSSLHKATMMLSHMFRQLLAVMETIGMLTKKEQSPLGAMGELMD